jgi:hypothetical protein
MAPKAKGSAKAKVVVGKDNAQSKAQCKVKEHRRSGTRTDV